MQDEKLLKRYRKRWLNERNVARLGDNRPLQLRHARRNGLDRALSHPASTMIALRRFWNDN